jgi:MSHA pilin protein MshD
MIMNAKIGPPAGTGQTSGARQRGVTIIEVVVAIVIVAMAATAVLGAMSAITQRGAETMVRQQAVAVAEAYLEEILLQPITQPTGGGTPSGRATYNDEDQYNNLNDSPPQDQYGTVMNSLTGYSVNVVVAPTTALTGITAANAREIDVTVKDPNGATVLLTGYRSNY